MTGKANLEVRPTFINKGAIASRLIADFETQGGGLEFVLCLGDDFTDEDMFRALNGAVGVEGGKGLDQGHVFSVTVGASSKMTLAKWHLLEPRDVISSVALLAGNEVDADVADLGALAVVEGKIPEDGPGIKEGGI
jgi:trehalose 6-phosphate synthase/phosphatase